jgi:hypothetical protein
LRTEALALEPWALEEEPAELREYTRILWRRRWLVALFFVGVVLSVAVFTLFQTPLYSADTTLLVEPTDPQVIDIKRVLGESYGYEGSYYNTQSELLASRSLAAQVIRSRRRRNRPSTKKLGLATLADRTFTGHLMRLVTPAREVSGEGEEAGWWITIWTTLSSRSRNPSHSALLLEPDPELAARV